MSLIQAKKIRYLAIIIVLLMYAVPFYQKYFSNPKIEWNNLEITNPDGRKPLFNKPYYQEAFVNLETPGLTCHVSSIASVEKDKLICTWYAGSREGARDVAIYRAFFQEEDRRWSAPGILLDRRQCSQELRQSVRKLGNAALMNGHGRLWLFYSSIFYGGWSTTSLNYKVSVDGGQTWSTSKKLILSPFFNLTNNVKNKGILLSNDSLLLPVYHELVNAFSQVVFIRQNHTGIFYEIRKITDAGRAVQPAVVPQGGKTLVAFFRNKDSGEKKYILRAESRNVGQSWSELKPNSLPNPDSGFDMLALHDGTILGVINPAFNDRGHLALVRSWDGGKTWKTVRVLEDAPGEEYSYPAIISSARYYHITYTYERKRIKHVVFNEAWLKGMSGYDN